MRECKKRTVREDEATAMTEKGMAGFLNEHNFREITLAELRNEVHSLTKRMLRLYYWRHLCVSVNQMFV